MSQESDYSVDIKLDALTQRANQIRADITADAKTLAAVTKDITDVLRQFRELANVWNFPDRNLPSFGETTRRDDEQTAKARDYLVGQICSAIIGGVALAVFAIFSFDFDPWMTIFVSLSLALLGERLCGAFLRRLVGASPKNRDTVKRVKLLLFLFGIITAFSTAGFAWLRFVEDEDSLTLLSLFIVGLEFGLFGLSAAFSGGHAIYRWSKDSDDTYRELKQQQRELLANLANLNADLVDLEFQIEQLKHAPETPTPTMEDFR